MANKRMFTMKIVDTDAFLEMPLSTQCLYFHLCMRADDDGFIGNSKRIIRLIGAATDDLNLLLLKRFVLPFENGVIVIKHWRMHNTLAKTRYHETEYTDEKSQLLLKENGAYSLTHGEPICDEKYEKMYDGCLTENKRRTDGEQVETTDRGLLLVSERVSEGILGVNAREDAPQQPEPLEVFSDELKDAVKDWIAYKAEKRQAYKPTGFKAMLTEIKNNAIKYGDEAVVEVIRLSMSSNYQGIVFDRLKNNWNTNRPANRAAQMLDESNEMMRRWAEE